MKHILVVDDVATNLKCVDLILRNEYELTMVKSGRAALNCLKTVTPDLILLDIYMLEMDGYEVMGHLKENPETADIPVILLTADDEEDASERGTTLGVAGFIRKPFEPQVLLNSIEAIWKAGE